MEDNLGGLPFPYPYRVTPIEGEALAVAWGLEQSLYFTQGCDDLVVVTDHKPLVKILGDRTLDEINNSRIFRLKQRTMPWHFEVTHLPGKTNTAADATSRHPSQSEYAELTSLTLCSGMECAIIAAIRRDASSFKKEGSTIDGIPCPFDRILAGHIHGHSGDPR